MASCHTAAERVVRKGPVDDVGAVEHCENRAAKRMGWIADLPARVHLSRL